jgi:hypothetical protein
MQRKSLGCRGAESVSAEADRLTYSQLMKRPSRRGEALKSLTVEVLCCAYREVMTDVQAALAPP